MPVATRYGGGRNNNRENLAEFFEAGTLHRLNELKLGLPCYTEDIVRQVENASFNVEYEYDATNALGSFSGGESKKQIPNIFKEAMTTLPQAARRKVASDKEIARLEKHSVDELVPITSVPNGRKVVGTRWVYKIKADGVYKGRVVVLGWSQAPGIDCFTSLCRLQSIRVVLAIAAELDYEVYVLDVQTSFLNADVEEEVFVKTVPGYERSNESGVPLVMKLKKSLKNWFSTMDHHLGKIGFRSLKSEPCVCIYEDENGSAIPTLYVDDVLLLGTNKQLLDKLKKQLMDRFEMTDMGDVSRVLGMNVTRDREEGIITINQKDYTEDIIQRYGMRGFNPAYTPGVGPELPLDQPEENLLNKEGKLRYQSITGAATYLAQGCRYDILYIVNQLARAMYKPSKAHMGATKHLVRYLAGSTDFSITYKQEDFKLTAFFDADWRENPEKGKSTSSYIILLSNGPIGFKAGIQGLTEQSTMEAELMAAALTMKEAVLQQHDAGARLQERVRQRAALHRQHIDTSRHRQPHIQPSRKAHRAEVLLCPGISGGG